MKTKTAIAIVLIVLILVVYKNRMNLESFQNSEGFDPSYVYKSPDQVMGRKYGRENIPVKRIIGRPKDIPPGDINPYPGVNGDLAYSWE